MKNLKKVVILAFNPQWLPLFIKGLKDLEFRRRIGKDWEVGTEVLLAITKNGGGSGKIEAGFIIKKIHTLYDRFEFLDWYQEKHKMGTPSGTIDLLKQIGYSSEANYAIEIKDFKLYDQPIELRDIYAYTKLYEEFTYLSLEKTQDNRVTPSNKNFVDHFSDCFIAGSIKSNYSAKS